MKFIALVSGGKDSCYNILHSLKQGHELVALGNLHPEDTSDQELDSFMFQTVGHDIVSFYEKCIGVPLFRQPIKQGGSKNVNLNYIPTSDDEIEDLYLLLSKVKQNIQDIEAVSVGAILSSYQRTRVENVCNRLGLDILGYLWERSQYELMHEMCVMSKQDEDDEETCKMDARLIKIASYGLNKTHLGQPLPRMFPILKDLSDKYGVNICGEGGEFETIVLDAPFFKNGKLVIKDMKYDTSLASSGVYNLQYIVEFVERKLSEDDLNKELSRLSVPPLLNDTFANILKNNENYDCDLIPLKVESYTSNKDEIHDYEPTINTVGDMIFISNVQCADSKLCLVEDQTKNVFEQLSTIFETHHILPCQVVTVNLLLKNMNDFQIVNKIYSDFFAIEKWGPLPPSRACVGSSLLKDSSLLQLSLVINKQWSIEQINKNISLTNDKNGLHVQSLSYWAPRNIGPYSQVIYSNKDEKKVGYISGQIALIPQSLTLEKPDSNIQAVTSLAHFNTIINTVKIPNILSMVCYVTDKSVTIKAIGVWKAYMEEITNEYCDSENAFNSLIIVKLSELPKGALIEWGGISCGSNTTNIQSYDSDEDDDDNDNVSNLNTKLAKLNIDETSSSIVVGNKDSSRMFITSFFQSISEFEDFKKKITVPYQINLYCRPEYYNKLGPSNNIMITFVENVYNNMGKEYIMGCHLFFEI